MYFLFFILQNGKQRNTVCISCFSFCMDGEKDPLFSRRRFIQSFPNHNSNKCRWGFPTGILYCQKVRWSF